MTAPFKPWAVVEGAGRDDERIVAECATYYDALCEEGGRYPTPDERTELHIDIMRRLDDGTFTTEY